jgi:hypothetical protein
MNRGERQLLEDRQTRAEARALFEARLDSLRGLAATRSPAQRLGDEVTGRAKKVAATGAEIAGEGRWIFAGVGVALAAWLARGPLTRTGKSLYRRLNPPEPVPTARRWLAWIERKVRP